MTEFCREAKLWALTLPAHSLTETSQAAKRGASRQCSAPAMGLCEFLQFAGIDSIQPWQLELLKAVESGKRLMVYPRPRRAMSCLKGLSDHSERVVIIDDGLDDGCASSAAESGSRK